MRVFILVFMFLFFLMPADPLSAQSVFGKFFNELSCFNKKNREEFSQSFDNFYEVEKNSFYRSKQLSEDRLDFYIKKYGIKTLINLRGNNQKKWWFKEKKVAEKNGVAFFSIAMSAVRMTKKEHLIELLKIYDTAPRPMLVHCIGGADRTGEASALW